MAIVTMRDLRNHGREVIDRVVNGERLTITRLGRPVAELRPMPKPGPDASALLARWKHLPRVQGHDIQRDLDETIDAAL
ncbi:MAG: type II toxin-antitoxin system prevent-host-death family antitoxin [Spirochaetaceae bacterium]|nr:type II toxin-antitoxin system prevent-host-death family antitoxin [Spirochaetaceae bacterium]